MYGEIKGSNLQSNDIFPKVGFVCTIHYTIDRAKILQISSNSYYKLVTQIHA